MGYGDFFWCCDKYLSNKTDDSCSSHELYVKFPTSVAYTLCIHVHRFEPNVRKHTFWLVHPTKTQISLCIRKSDQSSLFQWNTKRYSYQITRMRMLLLIFAGRTCPKVCQVIWGHEVKVTVWLWFSMGTESVAVTEIFLRDMLNEYVE